MEDKNPLQQAEELAGASFNARIENGVFMIEPAEAAIALLAAVTQHNDQNQAAWDAVDEMAARVEELREDNARLREALDGCVEWLHHAGYENAAAEVLQLLWPVRGVLEDGTEVEIVLDYDNEGNVA
jgi:hypothetical protein